MPSETMEFIAELGCWLCDFCEAATRPSETPSERREKIKRRAGAGKN
jgi:hypothetical protein